MRGVLPNSQKAAQTRGSAPWKIAFSLALYMAQDADGEPGRGSMLSLLSEEADCGRGAHVHVHVPIRGVR